MIRGILCVGLFVAFTAPTRAADPVFKTTIDGVDVQVMSPDGVKKLRGALVFGANHTYKPDDRWAVLCHELEFALVVMNIQNLAKATNRGAKLHKALDAGLKEAADKTGHPELVSVPLVGHGHSAGGLIVPALLNTPERLLTVAIDCGGIHDSEKWPAGAAGAPVLWTVGAIPDGFKFLETVGTRYEPARKKGLPWGVGVQWGCAHDYGSAATLTIPWVKAVAKARIQPEGKLKDMKLVDGWLGDRTSTNGTYASVAAWTEYKGDKEAAAWLPDREVAHVWRAWHTNKSPLVLEASTSTGDGGAKTSLPPWNPKKGRTLMVAPKAAVELGVTVKEGTVVKSVKYYDGDKLIGEATAAPWALTWKEASSGTHPVWAEWTGVDGKPAVTNAAMIAVRFKE